MLFSTNH